MLPVVRIIAINNQGNGGIGSGTVLYSGQTQGPTEEPVFSTYILTNHHVVSGLITVQDRWSKLRQKNVKQDVLGTPQVEFFEYRWASRHVGQHGIQSDIVAYDPAHDLALLHLRGESAV